MILNIQRFEQAVAKLDAANAADPNQEVFEGVCYPKELLYARRMSAMLQNFVPDPSEVLQLAARCQHICRWKIPRSKYPMDTVGYNCWRIELYKFHCEVAGEILREVGYGESVIADVQSLLRKDRIKTNPESQILEDVASLVFLQHYLEDFIKKFSSFDEDKFMNILRKIWKKMSSEGRIAALKLNVHAELYDLLGKVSVSAG